MSHQSATRTLTSTLESLCGAPWAKVGLFGPTPRETFILGRYISSLFQFVCLAVALHCLFCPSKWLSKVHASQNVGPR